MTPTHAELRRVAEPCSIAMGRPIDIVEMGLIEAVEPDGAGHVRVTLCLTDPACVHFRAMERYITDALTDLHGVESVHVTQTLDKLWTPDRGDVHSTSLGSSLRELPVRWVT